MPATHCHTFDHDAHCWARTSHAMQCDEPAQTTVPPAPFPLLSEGQQDAHIWARGEYLLGLPCPFDQPQSAQATATAAA